MVHILSDPLNCSLCILVLVHLASSIFFFFVTKSIKERTSGVSEISDFKINHILCDSHAIFVNFKATSRRCNRYEYLLFHLVSLMFFLAL